MIANIGDDQINILVNKLDKNRDGKIDFDGNFKQQTKFQSNKNIIKKNFRVC